MAFSYYIYYRVDPARSGPAEARVRELLAAVRKRTGIQGRLLTKRGEPNLWMEVYENITDDSKFKWELADAAGSLKVQEFLQAGGGRHVECFEDA